MAGGAVLTLAAGLADAVASIHRAGLVHRDIKPSNVIINDLGSARHRLRHRADPGLGRR